MQNTKNNKSKKFLNIALIALLAITVTSASVMIGCGSKTEETSATPDSAVTETRVVSETQVVTELVDVTGDASDDSKDSSGSKSDDNKNKSNSSSNSKSDNNSNNNSNNDSNNSDNNSVNNSDNNADNNNSNNNNSNNNNSNNSNGDNNSGNNSNNNNSGNNSNASGVLKIGGKSFNVGDTVKCTLKIKTPELVENFQGQIVYDTKYLECTKAKFVGEARGGSVINSQTTPGIIKFNGSSAIDGYDFTEGANMIEITYTVKGSGSTNPTDEWEIVRRLTEKGNGTNYASDGKPANGMTTSLSYSK